MIGGLATMGDAVERKHKGAHSELLACCYLLRHGFEVFRNISHHGLVDIIALKNNEIFKFDVKTATPLGGGEYRFGTLTAAQIEAGVSAIYVLSETECRIELRPVLHRKSEFICAECKLPFVARRSSNKFCTSRCRGIAGRKNRMV